MNIILVISFLLESIISNFIDMFSIFNPLFTLTTLVILYPYFSKKKEYFKMCLLFGLLYDLVFSNTLFINATLFVVVGLFTKLINYYLSNNIINNSIILIINIIIFRTSTYIILVLADILKFNIFSLFRSIYSSILLNLLYSIIIYFVSQKYIAKKKNYNINLI